MTDPNIALRLRNIHKHFGPVQSLRGVDLDVRVGEIHALVGENGAGKSTLAAIAYGELAADEGTVEAIGAVGLVHQHFELIGRLRVWENIILGREPRKGLRLDTQTARRSVAERASEYGLDLDVDAYVDTLPVGVQQRVELLRELERRPSVLLLDEPTAALAPDEIASFFRIVVALSTHGTAVLVVTHKLQEVLDYASRVTVLRHGSMIATKETAETSIGEIATMMIGGEIPALASRKAHDVLPCLHVTDLTAQVDDSTVSHLAMDVGSGEIVGIAGVEGNGQTAIADAILGLCDFDGSVTFAVKDPRIAAIPQDRLREAVVPGWSVCENMLLSRQHAAANAPRGWLNRTTMRQAAETVVRDFDVRPTNIDLPLRSLSGGNQQKIVVGRSLLDSPHFLLAYNPTRGIDVGAAALVQSRLIQARNDGIAILLISFDLDEILAVADRVLVLFRGEIRGTFTRATLDRARIGRLMAGGT